MCEQVHVAAGRSARWSRHEVPSACVERHDAPIATDSRCPGHAGIVGRIAFLYGCAVRGHRDELRATRLAIVEVSKSASARSHCLTVVIRDSRWLTCE